MSRLGAMLVLTSLLLCGLALSAQTSPAALPPSAQQPSTTAPSQQVAPPATAGEPSAQEQAHNTIEKLSTELNLTADQKSKLETILTGEIQQVHDLKADNTMSVEQKQAKFKETLTSDHAKIDSILTPEQKQKLTQLNQQRAAQQQSQSQGQAPSQTQPPAQGQTSPPPTPQTPK